MDCQYLSSAQVQTQLFNISFDYYPATAHCSSVFKAITLVSPFQVFDSPSNAVKVFIAGNSNLLVHYSAACLCVVSNFHFSWSAVVNQSPACSLQSPTSSLLWLTTSWCSLDSSLQSSVAYCLSQQCAHFSQCSACPPCCLPALSCLAPITHFLESDCSISEKPFQSKNSFD